MSTTNDNETTTDKAKLIDTCKRLVTWLYAVRDRDENLVIECGYDDFSLCDALGVIEKAEATQ